MTGSIPLHPRFGGAGWKDKSFHGRGEIVRGRRVAASISAGLEGVERGFAPFPICGRGRAGMREQVDMSFQSFHFIR